MEVGIGLGVWGVMGVFTCIGTFGQEWWFGGKLITLHGNGFGLKGVSRLEVNK